MKKFNSKVFFQIVAGVCFFLSGSSNLMSGNITRGIVSILVGVIFASVFSFDLKKSRDLKRSLANPKIYIKNTPKKKTTKNKK